MCFLAFLFSTTARLTACQFRLRVAAVSIGGGPQRLDDDISKSRGGLGQLGIAQPASQSTPNVPVRAAHAANQASTARTARKRAALLMLDEN